MSTILWLLAIWSKLERWKSLTNGCFMSWPKIKEKLLFWSVTLLIVCNNNRPFLNQIVACQEKWILCDNWQWPAQWLERKEPTALSKVKLSQKKIMVTGGLLPVWSTTTLWISVKPLHLRSMLSKLKRWTKNCNACSWHWLTEWAQFFSMITPNCALHNQCFNCWMNGSINFCLVCYAHLASCKLITTSSSISTTFCRENAFTTRRRQKMLSKSSSTDFYATGINKFISCWQNFVDCDGSYFA